MSYDNKKVKKKLLIKKTNENKHKNMIFLLKCIIIYLDI